MGNRTQPLYRAMAPQGRALSFVVSSPHSGCFYLPEFLSVARLELAQMRRLEDFCVEGLVADAPSLGAFLLSARFPRLWVDVNRAPYELDRDLFTGPLPAFADAASARARAGNGTFARLAGEAGEIYTRPLGWAEAQTRLERAYFPYHEALTAMLAEARAASSLKKKQVLLLDMHSMPSAAAPEADIVLGDRHGGSAAAFLTRQALDWLRGQGFRVSHNTPYAGGYITTHYGRPAEARHALQIELSRALYMDEDRLVKKQPAFVQLRRKMRDFFAFMGDLAQNEIG